MKFEEKHRPETLDDIIFVDAYVERIVKETAANTRHKHLILHGPRGAGKSEWTCRALVPPQVLV